MYIADIEISLYPFKVTVNNWYVPIGIVLIGIGMSLILYKAKIDGKEQGAELTLQIIRDYIDEKKSEGIEAINIDEL